MGLVKVTYKDVKPALTDTRQAIKEGSFFPKQADDVIVGDAEGTVMDTSLPPTSFSVHCH